MKLNKTKINTMFIDLSKECGKLFEETYDALVTLQNTYRVCISEEEASKVFPDEDEFEWFQLDTLEEVLDIDTEGVISKFLNNLATANDLTHRRLNDFKSELDKAKEVISELCEAYQPLMPMEVERVKHLLYEAIGHNAYFIYDQFGLEVFKETKGEEVDATLYSYCDTHDESILTVVDFVTNCTELFQPKMSLFDKFPQLEEEFMQKFESIITIPEFIGYAITLEDYNNLMQGLVQNPTAYIRDLEKAWEVTK